MSLGEGGRVGRLLTIYLTKCKGIMDIRLSTKDIEAGQTEDGGYTKAQLEVLGIPWQPPKGWKKSLVGKVVSADDYIKFLKLKDR